MSTQGYKYSSPVNCSYTDGTVIERRGDPSDLSSNGSNSSTRIYCDPMVEIR